MGLTVRRAAGRAQCRGGPMTRLTGAGSSRSSASSAKAAALFAAVIAADAAAKALFSGKTLSRIGKF
jgi:hypothetical protein